MLGARCKLYLYIDLHLALRPFFSYINLTNNSFFVELVTGICKFELFGERKAHISTMHKAIIQIQTGNHADIK